MTGAGGGVGLGTPPEGVVSGESVPRESEPTQITESVIEQVIGELKLRGRPYTQMSDDELREKALELIHKSHED